MPLPKSNKDDQGVEDAAILLMSLGEEEAAAVFKHLAPKEVQKLGETIARMKSITRERMDGVLDKFGTVAQSQHVLVQDTDEYVKAVLRKALGEDKANLLIDRILQGSDVTGIESLKWMDAGSVAELLRNEHPQIVAAILVHLDFDQSSGVLKSFTERQRNEVLIRIATLDGIQPSALKDLNEVMSKVLAGGEKLKKASLGGVKTAAEIINLMGSSVETSALDYIREADNELAQKIMDNMFTFDDLNKLDDKGFQSLLKEVQSESLVIALKGAAPELREKVFRNMSSRAAETLREDLDSRGPVRVSEVESEQKEMLKIVRRLVDEGQIVLASGGADDFL
ncbi:flagellar motor switch protein FliG [Scleromatobacter humisilvae]|uniref:Flagellar motor switch protein FliG n=1 Tax=Scleromatobacter humisilvae TaxID=2897159 RepID=A0A9X1YEC4_9BURK|nr:flagellar motor switch protein FliG [Scleromatobacter humisilvae]MCK9684689.1 flagellar motor switch protein FliG [Scleromatobacter humisilvae]